MTLAEALAVISTVNFQEAKPKQFEGVANFLESAIGEISAREQAVTKREREVSAREANASHREQALSSREQSLFAIERIKPSLKFWRGTRQERGEHA